MLGELHSPEIVQVDDSLDMASSGSNDERRNLLLFHEDEGRRREGAACDGEGVMVHDVPCGAFERMGAVALEEAAKISVRDHSDEEVAIQDCGHTKFLAGHLVDNLRHGRAGRYLRERFTGVH